MSLVPKKYLDSTGISSLWEKITAELAKKGQVNSLAAADNTVTIGGSAAAPNVKVNVSQETGNKLELKNDGLYINISIPAQTIYSVIEKTVPNEGYAVSYSLLADGIATGVDIDIPRDRVISSGSIQTVSVDNQPYSGAIVGDKYISLIVENGNNIYIPANDLVPQQQDIVLNSSTPNSTKQFLLSVDDLGVLSTSEIGAAQEEEEVSEPFFTKNNEIFILSNGDTFRAAIPNT